MASNSRFNGSKDDLLQVFNLYGLKVSGIRCFKDGIINTSYCLDIEDGSKLVLRVYQNGDKSSDAIGKELDFMEKMNNSGIPVPSVMNNENRGKMTIFSDSNGKEWRAIIMTFADGRHLKPDDLDIIPEFATYQAKMHLCSAKLNKNSDVSNFKVMVDWMDKEFKETKSKGISEETFIKIENIYTELKQDIELNYESILELPFGDVHLDYDSDNIIVSDGKIKAILDFDDISMQPFILDSANSIWWWLFNNKKEKYKDILQSYFSSYKTIREISEKEYKLLGLFMRMRNLTLICLLYVNISEETNYMGINEGFNLDPLLKSLYGFYSF